MGSCSSIDDQIEFAEHNQSTGITSAPAARALSFPLLWRPAFVKASAGSSDFCQPLSLGNLGVAGLDALAQGIHQGGHGLAVPVDQDAVVPVLHLVEPFAEVLAESNGTCFADQGTWIQRIDRIMMI
jgi:hypothetical protein